jgi:hypothetical protein
MDARVRPISSASRGALIVGLHFGVAAQRHIAGLEEFAALLEERDRAFKTDVDSEHAQAQTPSRAGGHAAAGELALRSGVPDNFCDTRSGFLRHSLAVERGIAGHGFAARFSPGEAFVAFDPSNSPGAVFSAV